MATMNAYMNAYIKLSTLYVVLASFLPAVSSFAPPSSRFSVSASHQRRTTLLFSQKQDNDSSLLDRFIDPVIDDPWLPLTEAGLAQIVAPSLELFFLSAAQSPFPSWANPIVLSQQALYFSDLPRGSFLAPTLIHGAGLACCWLLGALASKGYQRQAYEGNVGTVFWSTAKAGAFAVGLLIFATQLDLYTEMGGYVQVGDSVESDMRIYRALVEGINDCFFEALTLLSWRFYRSAAARYPLP